MFPQNYNYQVKADRLRRPVPAFVEDYTGLGTVETYTVIYDRQGKAVFGIVIARTPNGRRFSQR